MIILKYFYWIPKKSRPKGRNIAEVRTPVYNPLSDVFIGQKVYKRLFSGLCIYNRTDYWTYP
jgi:hypothetical protein